MLTQDLAADFAPAEIDSVDIHIGDAVQDGVSVIVPTRLPD